MALPILSQDKANHALYGAATAAIFSATLVMLSAPVLTAAIFGALASLAAGIGKEIYDASNSDKHTPDWRDAAVTFAGGLLQSAPLALVCWWIGR